MAPTGLRENAGITRVAIVGSGMAGLVTAYLLSRDARYKVVLFESGDRLSLDAASISIPSSTSKRAERVDLPMRAFAGGYYSNLRKMYDHIGVTYHAQPFLFHFSTSKNVHTGAPQDSTNSSYFIHSSNNHQIPPLRPSNAPLLHWLLETLYLLCCYGWFTLCCFLVKPQQQSDEVTENLGAWLHRIKLPQYFVKHYLLPLISSVATCTHAELLDFPASDLVNYKKQTHGAEHYTAANGVSKVQEVLSKNIETRLCTTVVQVQPCNAGVRLTSDRWAAVDSSARLQPEVFDKVILAVAPDIVGRIFSPLKSQVCQIPTVSVRSVVHEKRSERAVGGRMENAAQSGSKVGNQRGYDSRRSQIILLHTVAGQTESIHEQNSGVLVTTCPITPIAAEEIIHSSRFTRVLRTLKSQKVVNDILESKVQSHLAGKQEKSWRNGNDDIYLVGGWCWDGMVLLEGCVVSSMRVADALGVDIPWRP